MLLFTFSPHAGVYDVIAGLLLIKFGIALLMLFAGPGIFWLLVAFIASNRIFTEVGRPAVCHMGSRSFEGHLQAAQPCGE